MANIKGTNTNPNWYKNAYPNSDITVSYQVNVGSDIVMPGNQIKIKNKREVFLFRCLAQPNNGNRPWIDCISAQAGSWHSFPLTSLKEMVKPKRTRKKKADSG